MNGVVARRNNFNEPILQIPRGGLRGIRPADRPRLRPGHRIQDRRRRHGVRLAGLRGGQHRGRLRLSARAAQRQGRLHPRQRHPAVPGGGRHQRAARQEERHHPRTHGRGHGRRQPAGARHPRGAGQGQRSGEVRRRACPALTPEETPRLFRGSYGIGSRDFRPEHTLGAYEFATGQTRRTDGRGRRRRRDLSSSSGIDHPYAVISKDAPSLLPEGAIAVRFHSIGGWGMITTGKNLGEIVGEFGRYLSSSATRRTTPTGLVERKTLRDGQPQVRLREEGRAHQLLPHGRARRPSR